MRLSGEDRLSQEQLGASNTTTCQKISWAVMLWSVTALQAVRYSEVGLDEPSLEASVYAHGLHGAGFHDVVQGHIPSHQGSLKFSLVKPAQQKRRKNSKGARNKNYNYV